MTAALIAYIIAQIADVVTTERGLRRGGAEANRFIAWLMTNLGRGWIILKLGLSGALAFIAYDAGLVLALWVIAGITGAFAVNNVRVTRGRRIDC